MVPALSEGTLASFDEAIDATPFLYGEKSAWSGMGVDVDCIPNLILLLALAGNKPPRPSEMKILSLVVVDLEIRNK
jgi:hypothetical protein